MLYTYFRWLQVKRASKLENTIVLSVEGPGLEDYFSNESDCPSLRSFRVGVEFVSPLSYGDSVQHAFASCLNVKSEPEQTAKQGMLFLLLISAI